MLINLPKTPDTPEANLEWKIPQWSNAIERDRARIYFVAYAAGMAMHFLDRAFAYFDAEFTVLLFEFKAQIAQYLSTLGHSSLRTLADLIAFNISHCPAEMRYFGQELFELAESTSGDLTDPVRLAARAAMSRARSR